MKTKVRVSSQVESFLKSLAPEPRRHLRLAMKGLGNNRGNTKRLEGTLSGYSRLRVAGFRVIYEERAERGVRVIGCVFVEHRPIVYELFLKMLEEDALG